MREILFRGKRMDNGMWIEGGLRQYPNGRAGICCNKMQHTFHVDPETVGQYTGLKDKNGKMIFEGDIVEYGCDLMVVVWQEYAARFALKFSTAGDYSQSISRCNVYLEVIGNIHVNPELMKGE